MRKMERDKSCSHEPSTEEIRNAVGRLLDEVDADLVRIFLPPLSSERRQSAHNQLDRAPVMANYVAPICLNDSEYNVGAIIRTNIIVDLHEAIREGRISDSYHLLRTERYTYNSYAGYLYLRLIRGALIGNAVHRQRTLLKYASRGIWERDDVQAMHRAFLDLHEYKRFAHLDSRLAEAAVIVSHLLHDPAHPQYRGDLNRRLNHLGVDWRGEIDLVDVDPNETVDQLVVKIVDHLESESQAREEERFGEGSREAREAVDRLEYDQGRLSKECGSWTYFELEMWSRWVVLPLTLAELCTLVTEQVELMAFVGQVEFDGPCTELPPEERDTLLDIVRRAIRRATKRRLCELLSSYGAVPPLQRWLSRQVHNVEVATNYVPTEILSRLLTQEVGIETYVFGRGLVDVIDRYEEGKPVETPLLGSERFTAYLASDLHRKLFAPRVNQEVDFEIHRYDRPPYEFPLIFSAQNHTDGQYKWCALVVLKGRLAVSLVSTNQITNTDREGDLVIEREEVGQVLEPHRVELHAGDVLITTMSATAADDGATTPFDTDAFYDCLVLRPQDENAVWLEYGY